LGTYTPGQRPSRAPKKREAVPWGKYPCAIAHVEKTFTKQGKPRLSFQFRIAAGTQKGRMLFTDAYLEGRGTWKIEMICEVTDITEEFDIDDALSLVEVFQGRLLWVTWTEDRKTWKDRNGNTRSSDGKVSNFARIDASTREKLETEAA
jgi:hypothetical protein